jgi:tRNA nucleotidyltransferase (CCA-adding enzyme)
MVFCRSTVYASKNQPRFRDTTDVTRRRIQTDRSKLNQTLDWLQTIEIAASALSPQTWPFGLEWLPDSACLVGGTVRDALLGRYSDYLDLDFVLPEGAVETARTIARHYGAGFVLLDAERQIARVVFEQGTADFAQQVGHSLEMDLQRRDFTVNAIAYNPHTNVLIDPLQGYLDLHQQRIRMVSMVNLEEDPLRLLRAYRQAAQLDFELEPETRNTIRSLAPLLSRIAAERVQSELGYLLSTSKGTFWLKLAWEDYLLKSWFPDTNGISLQRIAAIDRAIEELATKNSVFEDELYSGIRTHSKSGRSRSTQGKSHLVDYSSTSDVSEFRQNLSKLHAVKSEPKASGSARTWLTIAKLASLVSPEPASAEAVLWRLKYSRAEIQAVSTLLKYLPELQSLATAKPISLKDQYLLFQGVGTVFPALAVSAVAMGVSVNTIAPLFERFINPDDPVAHPSPIITGQDLMTTLKIPPGPQIGQLLASIQLARAEGKITTATEALEFAKTLLNL